MHRPSWMWMRCSSVRAIGASTATDLGKIASASSTSEKLIPRENSQKVRLRHRLAASIALMMALLASPNVFAGARCSPFGDPPAQVDRGWYASFVTARNSVCLGGKLLGPWTDGNGDARYACLY